MAEHSREAPGATGLALRALSPAASIFKIVTAAALLEAGVDPEERVCYHGGRHRLSPRLLEDDPRRDRRCLGLADAFGFSANVVFAKLATRALTAEGLEATARRFLFDEAIPLAADAEVSTADVPGDRFGLGATAAGFGDVRLSALHAALLGAVVANDGLLVPPWLVDDVVGEPLPVAAEPRRVVDERVAAAIGAMMERTVSRGTARKVFRRPPPSLRGVAVAGKTGSLFERAPFRDHSWFVGYAPADAPRVVVATVVVNGPRWRVRAPWVAKEALAAWFADQVAAAPAAGGGMVASVR
jgi:cell division protein FtsI/penicillin-binding protein 2